MEKFFRERRVRPVSNVVLLPCQTNLIELLAILELGRTNFSYISVQNLANPLREKQLSEKIAGLPFRLMNTLARQACQLSQCETIRAC